MKTVGIVLGMRSYATVFEDRDVRIVDVDRPEHIKHYNVDVLMFCGGEDVDPFLYGEKSHPTTGYSPARDRREVAIYEEALRRGVKCCGICRGSQFLTVMNGGLLVQHIQGHGIAGTHSIWRTDEAGSVDVTSTHHQMMYPFNLPDDSYQLLAVGDMHHPMEGVPEGYDEVDFCVEAVWYPGMRHLCVQFHPEYMGKHTDGWKYYQELLDTYIFGD